MQKRQREREMEKKRNFMARSSRMNAIYPVKYTRAVLCASIWTNFMAEKYSMIIKYNMNKLPSSTNAGKIQIIITYCRVTCNGSDKALFQYEIFWIVFSFFYIRPEVGVKTKLKIWRDLMSRLLLLSTISHRSNFNAQCSI